jgi:hypothetical protein
MEARHSRAVKRFWQRRIRHGIAAGREDGNDADAGE